MSFSCFFSKLISCCQKRSLVKCIEISNLWSDAKSYPGMRSAASALSVSGRNVRAHPVINLELGGASASKSGGARVQLGGCLQDSQELPGNSTGATDRQLGASNQDQQAASSPSQSENKPRKTLRCSIRNKQSIDCVWFNMGLQIQHLCHTLLCHLQLSLTPKKIPHEVLIATINLFLLQCHMTFYLSSVIWFPCNYEDTKYTSDTR